MELSQLKFSQFTFFYFRFLDKQRLCMIYWISPGIFNYVLKNKNSSEKIKYIIHGIIKDSEGLLYGFLTHVGPRLRSREWRESQSQSSLLNVSVRKLSNARWYWLTSEKVRNVDWFQMLWSDRVWDVIPKGKKLIFRKFIGVVFESTCKEF